MDLKVVFGETSALAGFCPEKRLARSYAAECRASLVQMFFVPKFSYAAVCCKPSHSPQQYISMFYMKTSFNQKLQLGVENLEDFLFCEQAAVNHILTLLANASVEEKKVVGTNCHAHSGIPHLADWVLLKGRN